MSNFAIKSDTQVLIFHEIWVRNFKILKFVSGKVPDFLLR